MCMQMMQLQPCWRSRLALFLQPLSSTSTALGYSLFFYSKKQFSCFIWSISKFIRTKDFSLSLPVSSNKTLANQRLSPPSTKTDFGEIYPGSARPTNSPSSSPSPIFLKLNRNLLHIFIRGFTRTLVAVSQLCPSRRDQKHLGAIA